MYRIAAFLLLLLSTSASQAQSYSIHTLGFTGAEYTGTGNERDSSVWLINGNMLYGTSTRYDMAGSFNGHASWVYDRTTNVLRDVSLTDQEHISSTGFRSTGPYYALGNGDSVLLADRYNGGADYLGQSAWYYRQSTQTTTRIRVCR